MVFNSTFHGNTADNDGTAVYTSHNGDGGVYFVNSIFYGKDGNEANILARDTADTYKPYLISCALYAVDSANYNASACITGLVSDEVFYAGRTFTSTVGGVEQLFRASRLDWSGATASSVVDHDIDWLVVKVDGSFILGSSSASIYIAKDQVGNDRPQSGGFIGSVEHETPSRTVTRPDCVVNPCDGRVSFAEATTVYLASEAKVDGAYPIKFDLAACGVTGSGDDLVIDMRGTEILSLASGENLRIESPSGHRIVFDGHGEPSCRLDGWEATVEITGVTFRDYNGSVSAISNVGGSFYFTDCVFSNLVSTANGSAYCVGAGGSSFAPNSRFTNCRFDSCSSSQNGGAVFAAGTMQFQNATFIGNTVTDSGDGAAVYVGSGDISFLNTTFTGNGNDGKYTLKSSAGNIAMGNCTAFDNVNSFRLSSTGSFYAINSLFIQEDGKSFSFEGTPDTSKTMFANCLLMGIDSKVAKCYFRGASVEVDEVDDVLDATLRNKAVNGVVQSYYEPAGLALGTGVAVAQLQPSTTVGFWNNYNNAKSSNLLLGSTLLGDGTTTDQIGQTFLDTSDSSRYLASLRGCSIGAVWKASKYTYEIGKRTDFSSDKARLLACSGPAGDVTLIVPDVIQGRAIGQIIGDVFTSFSALNNLFLGEYPETFASSTVAGLASLTKIEVDTGNDKLYSQGGALYHYYPDHLELIYVPPKTKTLELAEDVNYVHDGAFPGGTWLTQLIIPADWSTKSLNDLKLGNYTNLTDIRFAGGSANMPKDVADGLAGTPWLANGGFMLNKDGTTLLRVYGTPTTLANLPSSVTKIANNAILGCTSLTSATIPARITDIGQLAFATCGNLEDVVFEGTMPTIGNNAFMGTQWGNAGGQVVLTLDGVKTLVACLQLPSSKTITVLDGVQAIGVSAFNKVNNVKAGLVGITMPDSVTSVAAGAIADCEKLEEIAFGQTAVSIASSAFSNCPKLAKVSLTCDTDLAVDAASQCPLLDTLELHASLASSVVAADSFQALVDGYNGNIWLKTLILADDITEIEDGALDDNTELLDVFGGNGLADMGVCFDESPWLSKVMAHEHIVVGGEMPSGNNPPFYWDYGGSGTDITLPESITHVDPDAFVGGGEDFITISLPKNCVAYDQPGGLNRTMFEPCLNLEKFIIADDALNYSVIDDCLYTKDGTRLIAVPAKHPNPPAMLTEAVVGDYGKWTLVELGVKAAIDAEAAGTVYTAKVAGLPSGLKLKYSAAVKNKKGKVVTPAKKSWWIEGVPTAAFDWYQLPVYVTITVGKTSTVEPLNLTVLAQNVVDLGDLALGTAIDAPANSILPGLPSGWTVTGLPKGLTFTAKNVFKGSGKKKILLHAAYTIYGKTTVPGLYTITAKKKQNGFYRTMKYRVNVPSNPPDAVNFPTLGDRESMVAVAEPTWLLKDNVGAMKSVTGLPSGFKFNSKKQTISGTATKAGTFTVKFVKKVGKKDRAAYIVWKVNPNPTKPVLAFNDEGGVFRLATQGTTYSGFQYLSAFTVSEGAVVKASGLPKGVTLVNLGGGSYAFKGANAKAGTSFVTVSATMNGTTVKQRVALTSIANPLAGTYRGYAILPGEKSAPIVLTVKANGTSTLTMTENGVKCTAQAKSISIVSQNVDNPREGKYQLSYVIPANTKKKLPVRRAFFVVETVPYGSYYLPQVTGAQITLSDYVTKYADSVGVCRALTAAEVATLQADGTIDPIPAVSHYRDYDDPEKLMEVITAKWNAKTGLFTFAGRLETGKAFSGSSPVLFDFGSVHYGWFRWVKTDSTVRNFVPDFTSAYKKIATAAEIPQELSTAVTDPAMIAVAMEFKSDGGTPEYFLIQTTFTPKSKKTPAANYVRASFDGGSTWTGWKKATWANGQLVFSVTKPLGSTYSFTFVWFGTVDGFEGSVVKSHVVKSKKTTKTVIDECGIGGVMP